MAIVATMAAGRLSSVCLIVILLALNALDGVDSFRNAHNGNGHHQSDQTFDGSQQDQRQDGNEFSNFMDVKDQAIADGERSYNLIREEGQMYGMCWLKAIDMLHLNCKILTDEVHSRLALQFTNCFLEKSGHDTYECQDDQDLKICLKAMDSVAMNAYTHFFTHTQNTCFFLASQKWQQKTSGTINRLSQASEKVTNQLQALSEHQEDALRKQLDLNKGIAASQASLDSFQRDLADKFYMMTQILKIYQELKDFMITGASRFYTVMFYMSTMFGFYFLTIPERTKNSRLILFTVFTLHAILESQLPKYFSDENDFRSIYQVANDLNTLVYYCRWCSLLIATVILAYYIYSFRDYAMESKMRLDQVYDKLKTLERLQIKELHRSWPQVNSVVDSGGDRNPYISEDDSDFESDQDFSNDEISSDEIIDIKTEAHDLLTRSITKEKPTEASEKREIAPWTPSGYNLRSRNGNKSGLLSENGINSSLNKSIHGPKLTKSFYSSEGE